MRRRSTWLRAGAGKVQIATAATLALPLGIEVPEVATVGLPENVAGEIGEGGDALLRSMIERCNCLVAGPAMTTESAAPTLVKTMLGAAPVPLVLDAAVLMVLRPFANAARTSAAPVILTPHIGEMAALLDRPAEEIEHDRAAAVLEASERFGAICALKGATTLVAAPDAGLFAFAGGGVGLATGGSGDVLAGIVAGLCARGADPLQATLWAVWMHGEAGRRCTEQIGPIGFLARELLCQLPGLLRAATF